MARRHPQPVRDAQVIRTCIGCGSREAKFDLLRIVADGTQVVPDPSGRMPGRGAYLHPSQVCLDKAQRRRAFPRALRRPGPLVTGGLASYLAAGPPAQGTG